jgi:hypothetical protein
MGDLHSAEYASMVDEGMMTLEQSVTIQLQNNHYPPVPTSMVEPCIKAIEAMNKGQSGLEIDLPTQVFWRGRATAPAWAIVEGHHLEEWLNIDED